MRSPYALVLAAAAAWALLGVWATELLDAGLEPVEIGFWRAAVGGGAFVAHAALTRRGVAGAQLRVSVPLGLAGVAVFYVALPAAVESAGIGLAWVLLYTAPAFVLVAGWALGRPIERRTVALVVVVLAGVALVAGAGDDDASNLALGVLWGLVSGATYALHYLLARHAAAGDGIARYAVALPLGAVVLVPLIDWTPKDAGAWALVVAIGVVSTYAPFLALATALRRADPGRASLVASLEPVMATLLAVAVYDETLGPLRIAGGLLVIGAAAAASQRATTTS